MRPQWGQILLVVAGLQFQIAGYSQTTPQFRASTDEVLIDVSVVDDDGRPVTHLVRDDFTVRDNGVEQNLIEARISRGPIDVVMVVQRFGNSGGSGLRPMSPWLDSAVGAAEERVRTLLDGTDTLLVLYSDRRRGDDAWPRGFQSVLYDDLTAAMMLPPTVPGRSRLVVGLTGGVNERSAVAWPALLETASRTDAVLYLFSLGDFDATTVRGHGRSGVFVAAGRSSLSLAPLAAATGGRAYRVGYGGDIAEAMSSTLEAFRTRYLLRYRPLTSPVPGWHQLAIDVRDPQLVVLHRAGYEVR